MNNLPVETRIDILAAAVSRLADALEAVIENLPESPREGPDFSRALTALEAARAEAERCMEV